MLREADEYDRVCVRANTLEAGDFHLENEPREFPAGTFLPVYQTDYDEPVCWLRPEEITAFPGVLALLWRVHKRAEQSGERYGRLAMKSQLRSMLGVEDAIDMALKSREG